MISLFFFTSPYSTLAFNNLLLFLLPLLILALLLLLTYAAIQWKKKRRGMNNQEKLAGFIFMCNRITKPECYRFRVFGLPAGRKEVVEKINPGTYLFLFDTDVKLLYGIYIATSSGKLRIEPLAFGQKFPAQVRFKIYKDCLPLPENCFKHAIQDNYQKDSNKFNPELNIRQVRSLLSLFHPLPVLSTAPTHPVLKKPLSLQLPPGNNVFHQVSRPSLFEEAYLSRMSPNQVPKQLNYKHVNELEEPTGYSHPVMNMVPNSAAAESVPSQASRIQLHPRASQLTLEGTYAAGMGGSYTRPMPDPHYTHQNIINPQHEFHSSLVNRGSGHHAQSLQDPQHAHQNVLHPQPEFHSSMMAMGNSHAQSLQDPQNSYAQSLPDPQHTHQNTPNLQPDFNSSVVNMGHANVMMQSHASSSRYFPYVPQEVVSATYSYQWSGAIQG